MYEESSEEGATIWQLEFTAPQTGESYGLRANTLSVSK